MRIAIPILLALMGTTAGPPQAGAADFFLKGGETIVFFGDSITQGGAYVEYVDAFLATRLPEKRFRVINSGISSETISGTSEPDHDPRRPFAHRRFDRDVAAYEPDVVVACFGMNDGNYFPFEPERFEKYQQGVRRLERRVRDAGRRLVLMTPPPYDPYRRKVIDPDAVTFGYKFPAVDYDATLERYSRWLLGLRDEGLVVADVHSAMNGHLQKRRREKVSFYLSGDAVHPGPTGHWLMAQTLLLAWHAPAVCADADIDAESAAVRKGRVSGLRQTDAGLSFRWTTPLPMPADPRWDAKSIRLEDMSDRLNRFRLRVTGLPGETCRLLADSRPIAELPTARLETGIDLTPYAAFPPNERAKKVLNLVQKRRRAIYKMWRSAIAPENSPTEKTSVTATARAEAENEGILEQIRDLCRPREIEIRLQTE